MHNLLFVRCTSHLSWCWGPWHTGRVFSNAYIDSSVGRRTIPVFYGLKSFHSASKNEILLVDELEKRAPGLTGAIATTLALTLLNPHVYLDTVILLGSIAGQLPERERLVFAIGAACSSMLWFYGTGYGARILTSFSRDKSPGKFSMY